MNIEEKALELVNEIEKIANVGFDCQTKAKIQVRMIEAFVYIRKACAETVYSLLVKP